VVLKEFLPFFMQSETFFERALSISVGSLSPTINWKTLSQQEFALPPQDEQRRIAEILWAADAVLEQFQSCASAAVRLQRMYFEDWLSSNATNNDWPEVSLDAVCTIQSGQIDPTVHPYCDIVTLAS
jgi:hypothetical protein